MSLENSTLPANENSTQSSSLQELENTKHRRLVPQFSLTSQNLGSDNGRGRSVTETTRKTVIRFTREQLIAMRKTSNILPSMSVMTEISSVDQLDPVCFTKLEPEDVIRICSVKDVGNRGRGRVVRNFQKGDDELDGDNGREEDEHGSKSNSLWDDDLKSSDAAHEFNLADIAQASLKFRSDFENMRSQTDTSEPKLDEVLEEIEESLSATIGSATEAFENEKVVVDIPKVVLPTSSDVGFQDNLKFNIFGATNTEFPASTIISEPFAFSLSSNSNVPSTIHSPTLFPPRPSVEYFYTDPQNQIQGPFTQDNMRQWNDAGYFTNDLPIKMKGWSKFYLFQEVFPEPKLAFYGIPTEPVPVSLAVTDILKLNDSGPIAKINENNSISYERDRAVLKVDKSETVEQSRVVENAKPTQTSNKDSQKDSSKAFDAKQSNAKTDFAKQLLGINRPKSLVREEKTEPSIESVEEISSKVESVEVSSKGLSSDAAKKSNKAFKGWTEDSAPKSSVSLVQIQQEELKRAEVIPVQNVTSTNSNTNAARSVQLKSILGMKVNEEKANKAWASSNPPETATTSAKSLMDIMNEEKNKQQQKRSSHEKASASSWAAKAKPSAEQSSSSTFVSNMSTTQAKNFNDHSSTSKSFSSDLDARAQTHQSRSDFGGKQMSKEMSDWCTTQLKKINGSSDLTLLEFCMTLKSPVEIREYFSHVLGSSPQVTNFATQFINLKEGKKVESLVPVQIHDNFNTGKKKRQTSTK